MSWHPKSELALDLSRFSFNLDWKRNIYRINRQNCKFIQELAAIDISKHLQHKTLIFPFSVLFLAKYGQLARQGTTPTPFHYQNPCEVFKKGNMHFPCNYCKMTVQLAIMMLQNLGEKSSSNCFWILYFQYFHQKCRRCYRKSTSGIKKKEVIKGFKRIGLTFEMILRN